MQLVTFRPALITSILSARPDCTEVMVELDGTEQKAICFTALIGTVAVGDSIIVNTTAVDLGLGTGGYHFALWNLARTSIDAEGEGHIMKLRYTPLQMKCLAAEEETSRFHDALRDARSIDGMPVIVGTLHSQLPAAAATLRELHRDISIAYIMTDGAALPLAFSRTVAELKGKGIINTTITVGHAFGGDIEAINIYSGLAAARCAAGADVAIVCMGPGIVGSNTALGFSGIEQGQIVNAVNSLQGVAIAIPRLSFKDKRERHFGISHHTITALKLAALSPAIIAVPEMDAERERIVFGKLEGEGLGSKHRIAKVSAALTLEALQKRNLAPTTMGRSVQDEPEFFMAAGAAAIYASSILTGG